MLLTAHHLHLCAPNVLQSQSANGAMQQSFGKKTIELSVIA